MPWITSMGDPKKIKIKKLNLLIKDTLGDEKISRKLKKKKKTEVSLRYGNQIRCIVIFEREGRKKMDDDDEET